MIIMTFEIGDKILVIRKCNGCSQDCTGRKGIVVENATNHHIGDPVKDIPVVWNECRNGRVHEWCNPEINACIHEDDHI